MDIILALVLLLIVGVLAIILPLPGVVVLAAVALIVLAVVVPWLLGARGRPPRV